MPVKSSTLSLYGLFIMIAFIFGFATLAHAQTDCQKSTTCEAEVTAAAAATHEASSLAVPLPEPPFPDPPPVAPAIRPLTVGEKFTLGAHRAFGPQSFVIPALVAGSVMADPPDHFPAAWHDGASGFGRLYGDYFTRNTANYAGEIITAAIVHEDPRYFPSTSKNLANRFFHAIIFTLVDKSDSGHRTLALSNFAGSAAGGFVTMAYEPRGFDDITHAEQRASVNMAVFAGLNLVSEFSPDLARLFHLRHMSNQPQSAAEIRAESFPTWWAGKHPDPKP